MKYPSVSLAAAVLALLTSAASAVSTVAQAPQAASGPPGQAQPGGGHEAHEMPAPTNLKVLPKNLTGAQVHEIMEKWAGSLGTHCSTCHAADPKNVGPNGRPRLNFADDSKEEKLTARLMYKMTEDINANYVAKVPNSDAGVSCGTCHRGHLGPEPFVVPEDDHDHDHAGTAPATPPAPKQ